MTQLSDPVRTNLNTNFARKGNRFRAGPEKSSSNLLIYPLRCLSTNKLVMNIALAFAIFNLPKSARQKLSWGWNGMHVQASLADITPNRKRTLKSKDIFLVSLWFQLNVNQWSRVQDWNQSADTLTEMTAHYLYHHYRNVISGIPCGHSLASTSLWDALACNCVNYVFYRAFVKLRDFR